MRIESNESREARWCAAGPQKLEGKRLSCDRTIDDDIDVERAKFACGHWSRTLLPPLTPLSHCKPLRPTLSTNIGSQSTAITVSWLSYYSRRLRPSARGLPLLRHTLRNAQCFVISAYIHGESRMPQTLSLYDPLRPLSNEKVGFMPRSVSHDYTRSLHCHRPSSRSILSPLALS